MASVNFIPGLKPDYERKHIAKCGLVRYVRPLQVEIDLTAIGDRHSWQIVIRVTFRRFPKVVPYEIPDWDLLGKRFSQAAYRVLFFAPDDYLA
jgi:hypothetical protein